ncbi:hypothetical protein ANN_05109 [Periplaneta americana]|uniref:Uncharacterized protein n=1 Tax=Periplaneta americana TaxID=6978 RepID=A0ABQ8TA77_PERAM|nr:hypothetical protein ANN_05109 [Periplaneta americana]
MQRNRVQLRTGEVQIYPTTLHNEHSYSEKIAENFLHHHNTSSTYLVKSESPSFTTVQNIRVGVPDMAMLSDLRIDSAQKLQRVHNACVRFICNVRYYDHISPSFKKLSWLRLHERRNLHLLSLLYRIMHSSSPYYLFARFHTLSRYHNINTRSQRDNTLEIPLHASSLYSSSFTVATSRHWNSLPPEVKGCRTLNSFKSKLENYLMTSCQTNLLL